MSLSYFGEYAYRTTLGGLVSMLTFAILFAYGFLEAYQLYYHPVYNFGPTTKDYDYNETIAMDWRRNMVSY